MTGPNGKRDERSEITNNPNINRGYACEASEQQSARRLNDAEILTLTMNMGDAVIRKAERAERAELREPTPSRPRQKREEEKSKQFLSRAQSLTNCEIKTLVSSFHQRSLT
jgi:hypothetical protein